MPTDPVPHTRDSGERATEPPPVLVLSREPLVAHGLQCLLREQGHAVVGIACPAELTRADRRRPWLLAILDAGRDGFVALDALRRLEGALPAVPCLWLGDRLSTGLARRVLAQGVSGIVLRSEGLAAVRAAIARALDGAHYVCPGLAERVLFGADAEPQPALSDRESQVLHLLARGCATREIAATLHISVKTVATHRANLLTKLGLDSTAAAVAYALRSELASETG